MEPINTIFAAIPGTSGEALAYLMSPGSNIISIILEVIFFLGCAFMVRRSIIILATHNPERSRRIKYTFILILSISAMFFTVSTTAIKFYLYGLENMSSMSVNFACSAASIIVAAILCLCEFIGSKVLRHYLRKPTRTIEPASIPQNKA